MDAAKVYVDSDGEECSIVQMVRREPEWAANRVQEGEKAISNIGKKDEMLKICRDALAALEIDALGEGECDGIVWPIRDEIIDKITQCLLEI